MGTATVTASSSTTNLQAKERWNFSAPLTLGDKRAALDGLFGRIAPIARAMGGKSYPGESYVAFEADVALSPRTEAVPSLHVEMVNGLVADFGPSRPLRGDGVLLVQARRWFHVSRIADRTFNFSNGEWQTVGRPLTEEQIRHCLSLEGPLLTL